MSLVFAGDILEDIDPVDALSPKLGSVLPKQLVKILLRRQGVDMRRKNRSPEYSKAGCFYYLALAIPRLGLATPRES